MDILEESLQPIETGLHVFLVPSKGRMAAVPALTLENASEAASRLWKVPPGRLLYMWSYSLEAQQEAR